jgi:DNA-binding NarL/FixJ family response regulator
MPMAPTERAYFEPILDRMQEALGAARFTAAWSQGRAWSRDLAITEALSQPTTPAPAISRVPHITGRERDVLRELMAGKSNREISEALYVSPTTVATHMASLYRKLGVDSRAEAIAWAHRHEAV